MSHALFFHVFMAESEINTFTFRTNIFGKCCYISILNYNRRLFNCDNRRIETNYWLRVFIANNITAYLTDDQ